MIIWSHTDAFFALGISSVLSGDILLLGLRQIWSSIRLRFLVFGEDSLFKQE